MCTLKYAQLDLRIVMRLKYLVSYHIIFLITLTLIHTLAMEYKFSVKIFFEWQDLVPKVSL
jgi:hypothetical protein